MRAFRDHRFAILATAVAVVAGVLVVAHRARTEDPGLGPTPWQFNFQGYLTDAGTDDPLDGTYDLVFSIYDAPAGGTALFTERQRVQVNSGFFSCYVGAGEGDVLHPSILDGGARWLAVQVGVHPEMTPRFQLAAVPYAQRGSGRDHYHGVLDLPPSGKVTFWVYPRFPGQRATLRLHGEAFGGATAAHGHLGVNAHTHGVATRHVHSVGSHTHTGTTGSAGAHTPTASTNSTGSHTHTGSTATAGNHQHAMRICGRGGNYLVVEGCVSCGLSGTCLSGFATANNTITSSVQYAGDHAHGFTTASAGGHSHTVTVGAVAAHSHSVTIAAGGAGNTGEAEPATETTSAGTGLASAGVSSTSYPSDVQVFVINDLVLPTVEAAVPDGPWGDGTAGFSSGPVDLSTFISEGEARKVEIRTDTGGRIVYDLFVE